MKKKLGKFLDKYIVKTSKKLKKNEIDYKNLGGITIPDDAKDFDLNIHWIYFKMSIEEYRQITYADCLQMFIILCVSFSNTIGGSVVFKIKESNGNIMFINFGKTVIINQKNTQNLDQDTIISTNGEIEGIAVLDTINNMNYEQLLTAEMFHDWSISTEEEFHSIT